MSKKPQTCRDVLPVLVSEMEFPKKKSKSALMMTPPSTSRQKPKNLQRVNTADVQPFTAKNTPRVFRLGVSPVKDLKRNYVKNSDKTIKPPEKPLKTVRPSEKDVAKQPEIKKEKLRRLTRADTIIKSPGRSTSGSGKRSLTHEKFEPPTGIPSFVALDTKTIGELEKRLEHLQTIFMNKLEILKSRYPENVHKEYKFISMVIDNEAKLVVKETETKCVPSFLPAKSVEDLHLKIGKFFTGCLLCFTDKLRKYQGEGRAINCEDIYKELKREENDFCGILRDWVTDVCNDTDTTIVAEETKAKNVSHRATQTDDEPKEEMVASSSCNLVDLVNLRVERSELKEQLSKKDEHYMDELNKLKEQFELETRDLLRSLSREQTHIAQREDELAKEQEMNEILSQQLKEAEERFRNLTEINEELKSQLNSEKDLSDDLTKMREELQSTRDENKALLEMKTNFLKKLNQRSTRIDLLEKEIKQQKRKIECQSKEIEEVKDEYEAKVKQSRQYKESLEARNQLITDLRAAVGIEQKKRREYESIIAVKNKDKPTASALEAETDKLMSGNNKRKIKRADRPRGTKAQFQSFPTCKEYTNEEKRIVSNTCETNEISEWKIPSKTESVNPFKLNIPKSDLSSEDDITPMERFRDRKKRNHTIVIRKYEA